MSEKFHRLSLSAYITSQDDANAWALVVSHYGEPDRSASSIIVQLVREKALAIQSGQTKRQQLQAANDGIARVERRINCHEQLLVAIAEKLGIDSREYFVSELS